MVKPEELIPLVTIMAIGCDHYDHLKDLYNVRNDIARLKEVFCLSDYSIYSENKFIEIFNKTSSEFRKAIQNYIFSLSAEQQILILFFSGHGTAIGRDDFGFCMNDAVCHDDSGIILPTSVVKLSEIIGTLNIKNVSLILLVDACYSGQISKQLTITFPEISSEMSKSLIAYTGNYYGLITSCTDVELIKDIGVISKALKDICDQGSEDSAQFITLTYLSEVITERIDKHAKGDSTSRVFVPSGRNSKLPMSRNVQFYEKPEPVNIYSFTTPYFQLLLTLWNDGQKIALTPTEILDKTGSQSAYANHKKLSLGGWELLKDDRNGKRELTQRGIDFLNGKITIPKIICENKITRLCMAEDHSPLIQIVEEKDLYGETHKKIAIVS